MYLNDACFSVKGDKHVSTCKHVLSVSVLLLPTVILFLVFRYN
jgi:hypothetical protein